MRIGVFDSGVGGEAVAKSLQRAYPTFDILLVDDREHIPYGTRSPGDVLRLTNAAIQPLLKAECDVIVLACNTATAAALPQLRLDYPDQLFIGLEPMIGPAAKLTKTKTIAVCATPTTLLSKSYKRLKLLYGATLDIVEPDCSEWASLIEANDINMRHIDQVVQQCLERDVDVIVLGCTHYHWIKEEIQQAAGPHITILEPSTAIAQRVKELLSL
jgi:glutamate racemase